MAGPRQLLHPSRALRRRALYSGVFGGNRAWLGVGVIMWCWKTAKRLLGKGKPITRYVQDLKPGDRLVITHPKAPPRRGKRSA